MADIALPPRSRKIMVEIEREMCFTRGVPPSVRELAAKIGARASTSTIQRHLMGLEKRGIIRRLRNRRRAIEILVPVSRFDIYAFCGKTKTLVRFDQSVERSAIAAGVPRK